MGQKKKKAEGQRPRPAESRGRQRVLPAALAVAALGAVVAAVKQMLAPVAPAAPAVHYINVEPNGGGEPWRLKLDEQVPEQLAARYPKARRVGLWSADGIEMLWSGGPAHRGGRLPPAGTPGPLYAVVDDFPFVWPHSAAIRTVDVGDRTVQLESLSARPRVLIAHGVLSAEECEVVVQAAEPRMAASTTLVKGQSMAAGERQSAAPRTSSTSWLRPHEAPEPDRSALEAVQRRVAMLARLHVEAAEAMQVLRYRPGEHYHYHTDTGGAPHIAGRALTALFYLNSNFSGGQTNFPTAGLAEPMKNVYRVRETYQNCQTEAGLSVQPRQGSVLLLYNLEPNTATKDFYTWHGSCDVSEGEKWAANLWYNLNFFPALVKRGLRPAQCPPA